MLIAGKQVGMSKGYLSDVDAQGQNPKLNLKLVDKSGIPSVNEMVTSGNKTSYNYTNPKFGIKGYKVQDSYLAEPYYKIDQIRIAKRDKKDDHFTDLEALRTKKYPPCKFGQVKWEMPPVFSTTQHAN